MQSLELLYQQVANQQFPAATLYVVAMPIGNMADITVRALYTLQLADAIACEDTRHSRPLLTQWGINKPLLATHEHNEREAAATIIERLAQGERIALISDAGTPAISDPGAIVVEVVRAAGYRVVPIPGVSAAVCALSATGVTGGFSFLGFLSPKSSARRAQLERLAQVDGHWVLYESPHRLHECVADLAYCYPERRLTIARELTKLYESTEVLELAQAAAWIANAAPPRGEYVLIVHAAAGAANNAAKDAQWAHVLSQLIAHVPLKQAVALTCSLTQAPKNEVYARALQLKQESSA